MPDSNSPSHGPRCILSTASVPTSTTVTAPSLGPLRRENTLYHFKQLPNSRGNSSNLALRISGLAQRQALTPPAAPHPPRGCFPPMPRTRLKRTFSVRTDLPVGCTCARPTSLITIVTTNHARLRSEISAVFQPFLNRFSACFCHQHYARRENWTVSPLSDKDVASCFFLDPRTVIECRNNRILSSRLHPNDNYLQRRTRSRQSRCSTGKTRVRHRT